MIPMDDKHKQVYAQLSGPDKKAFRAALENDDLITVTAYLRAAGVKRDLVPLPEGEKRGRGRPELVEHNKQIYNAENRQLRNTKNVDNSPEAGADMEILDFSDLYTEIINSTCEGFYNNHPDIIKRPPYMWVNTLLLECKKQLPVIDIKDAQRVGVAWDAFKALMYKIGLFPMMEAFTNMTGIYKQSLAAVLTPEHDLLRQKIFDDCRDNMLSQVGYNTNTQINKIFLLKSVYGFNESGPAHDLAAAKTTKKIDDIPLFSIEDKSPEE